MVFKVGNGEKVVPKGGERKNVIIGFVAEMEVKIKCVFRVYRGERMVSGRDLKEKVMKGECKGGI